MTHGQGDERFRGRSFQGSSCAQERKKVNPQRLLLWKEKQPKREGESKCAESFGEKGENRY